MDVNTTLQQSLATIIEEAGGKQSVLPRMEIKPRSAVCCLGGAPMKRVFAAFAAVLVAGCGADAPPAQLAAMAAKSMLVAR